MENCLKNTQEDFLQIVLTMRLNYKINSFTQKLKGIDTKMKEAYFHLRRKKNCKKCKKKYKGKKELNSRKEKSQ